jgi:hypothetical protein
VPELDQPDVDLGPVAPPHAQRGRQDTEAHRVHRGDLQLARRRAGREPGGAARAFGVGQRRPRVRQHRPAHRGEPDGAGQPLEQRPAEAAFQGPHLVRQRRLRDVQLLGGAGERAGVDHRDQVLQLPQARHDHSLSTW